MSTSITRARVVNGVDVAQAVNSATSANILQIAIGGGATFAEGTSAGQINAVWSSPGRALGDGANETLNLTNASLTDEAGRTVDFSKLEFIYIKNNFALGDLQIGAASTPVAIFKTPATDCLLLPPGKDIIIPAYGLDISTNGSLKITHDGTGSAAGTYDIVVGGVGVYA